MPLRIEFIVRGVFILKRFLILKLFLIGGIAGRVIRMLEALFY